ncbi:MAG: sugar phosphate isomerase/epimerase [Planctomycetota bacterium]|nr:sugar phosphate isomerase/epimerase [Planctomycetota bacterium]
MTKSPARNVGVQSYCFRNFKDNYKVAQLTKEIGVNTLEICAVHANFDDPEEFKKILDIYRAQKVEIVSIGVQTFTGDIARERKWFACAKAAGAKHISAHFRIDSFQTAVPAVARLCDEFNIRVGIHCHGGYWFGGSPDVLQHLIKLGNGRIGINLDTAWCMQIGPQAGDPIKWIRETFPSQIFAVHYKDFVFDHRAMWTDVVIGAGNLDLPGVVAALEQTNFAGIAVIEYEGDADNPVPALKQCVEQIRNVP